jgi:hypothetical protein
MLACHHCQLSGSQAATHNNYTHVPLMSQLGCHGRIRKLSNLHGMATSLSSFTKPSWDRRCIPRSNSKHNTTCVMYALVRAYREDLLGLRHPWNSAKIDVFDSLLLYEISPKSVPIDYTLAIVPKEGT